MINTELWKKEVFLASRSQPIITGSKGRNLQQNPQAGAETTLLTGTISLLSHMTQELLPRVALPTVSALPNCQENVPKVMPTAMQMAAILN